MLSNADFMMHNKPSDNTNTVFVGALHGTLTAMNLAKVMNDLFGDVIYVGLDTDIHKYPIGEQLFSFKIKNRLQYFLLFTVR